MPSLNLFNNPNKIKRNFKANNNYNENKTSSQVLFKIPYNFSVFDSWRRSFLFYRGGLLYFLFTNERQFSAGGSWYVFFGRIRI